MRVPTKVSVTTDRPAEVKQFARAPAVVQGADFFDTAKKLAGDLEQIAKDQQAFDLNSIYVKKTGERLQDFQERRNASEPNAYGFALRVQTDYEKEDKDLIDGLRKTGHYDDAALDNLGLQLQEGRNRLIVPSLEWEKTSITAQNDAKLDELGVAFSQRAAASPGEIGAILEGIDGTVADAPGFTSVERTARAAQMKKAAALSAGQGLALSHPDQVIQVLTGRDPYTMQSIGVVAEGNAKPYAQALTQAGLPAPVVAGILGNIELESGFNPKGSGDGGTAHGVIQWREARVDNFISVTGVHPRDATPEQVAQFIKWEFDNPEKAGMTVAQRDQILAASTSEEAAKLFDQYYERSSGATRDERAKAAAKYVVSEETSSVATTPMSPDGKTGIPALDLLDTSERLQVLNIARTEFNRVQTTIRADVDVRHENAVAAATQGEEPKNAPTQEEYSRAYGPVAGPQKYAELTEAKQVGTFVAGMKQQSDVQIAAGLEAIRPKDPSSPTYATELKGYEAATQAANKVLEARKQDPAGYVISQYPGVKEAWAGATDAAGRRHAYRAMQIAYNQLNTPTLQRLPMTNDQAAQMKEQLAVMSPEQKLETIKSWRSEMGDLFPQGMRQLSEHGMVVESYLANMMLAAPETSGMAANVLRGLRVIEENKALAPAWEDVNQIFVRTIDRGTQLLLAPDQVEAIKKSALALYVLEGNDPKVISSSKMQGYIRMALGGSRDNAHTGWYNEGRRGVPFTTILPPGISDNQFKLWKDGLTGNDLVRLGGEIPRYGNRELVPAAAIAQNGVLVRVAPNRYQVRMSPDGGTLMKKDGTPYIMIIVPSQIGKHF